MAFPNVKRIVKIGSPLSSYKLLLTAARFSRPKYDALCLRLLQPFVKAGEISVKYRCYGRLVQAFIRMSDLQSDFTSTLELGVLDVYHLDRSFRPEIVIDGGGNIGLFTLRAAASALSGNDSPIGLKICEPVPENVRQIEKHLSINGVKAEIMPVCLGGTRRSIQFYCREANQSSFDPSEPYTSVMEVPVVLLQDAIGSSTAKRILIKLDIEGMEIEALSAFVPGEQRAVYIVGELHDYKVNAPLIERIFHDHGWALDLKDVANNLSSFTACSPAAIPLLASMSGVRSRAVSGIQVQEMKAG